MPKLILKRRNLIFGFILVTLMTIFAVSNVPAATSPPAPVISSLTPAIDSIVNSSNITISFAADDPDNIVSTDHFIKLNGTPLTTNYSQPSQWIADSCSTGYWQITNPTHANISATASGLQDGINNIEVQVKDALGNTQYIKYSVNVAVKPILSSFTPANGGLTGENNSISVKITDNSQINPASFKMIVDGFEVIGDYNPVTGIYSYTPPSPQANGTHTVSFSASDMNANPAIASWSYTVLSDVVLSFANDGKTFTNSSPILSVNAKAGAGLNNSAVSMTLDGQVLNKTVNVKSLQEADYVFQASGLKDGNHTLEVTAKDINGKTSTSQWNFTVQEAPVISNISPANGSTTKNNSYISVKISDNDQINQNSILMTVDGSPVLASYDPVSGILTYNASLLDGVHNTSVQLADMAGNQSTLSWSFTIMATPPQIIYTDDGKTFNTSAITLSLSASSSQPLDGGSVAITVDEAPVSVNFAYPSHYVEDSCSGGYWEVDNYTVGTITGTTPLLNDGNHTIVATIKDTLGNVQTKTFNITIAVPPVVTLQNPGSGSITQNDTNISLKVTDNGQIDANTINMNVDGNTVHPTFDANTGIVTYTAQTPLGNGTHNVTFSVADVKGNVVNSSWSYTVLSDISLSFADDGKDLTTASPTLTVNAKAGTTLNITAAVMTLDGNNVTYTPSAISSQEANYVYKAIGLKDGSHTLSVTAKDINGNTITKTWAFTVKEAPLISNLTPIANTVTNSKTVSARITDNDQIDPATIKLTINAQEVVTAFDSTTGTVTYNKDFATGDYIATLSVADKAGNTTSTTWTFSIYATGPEITIPEAGKTFDATQVSFSISANSTQKIDSTSALIYIDGTPIATNFSFPMYYVPDSCSSAGYWAVESYYRGTITGNTPVLTDGEHLITVTIKDEMGNNTRQEAKFIIGKKPTFSDMSPANGSVVGDNRNISVKATDNVSVNPDSVILLVDNVPVQASFDLGTGVISYQKPDAFSDGVHTVEAKVSDPGNNQGTTKWSFTVRTTGPDITYEKAGQTYSTYRPEILVNLKSTANLSNTDYNVNVDGQPVNATLTYTSAQNQATLKYTPNSLNDGNHELSVTAKDTVGNATTKSWTFAVNQLPIFKSLAPANNTTVGDKKPTIVAEISDPNGPAIDKNTIKLTVNGSQVVPSLTDVDGGVNLTYISPVELKDMTINVSLSASNTKGESVSSSWKFSTSTDMVISAQSCGACHTLNQYNKWTHTQFWGDCDHCHSWSYEPSFCGYCHEPASLQNKNCVDCHTTNHATANLLPTHQVDKGTCNNCHSPYLTREHNRVTTSGVQLNCATCHRTSLAAVQTAVNNNNKDCSACHGDINHETVHISPIDSTCLSCHKNSISEEHTNNSVTTGGKNYDCYTCHNSSRIDVRTAIKVNNTQCTACHTVHGNIDELHTTTSYASNLSFTVDCSNCHQNKLNTEHQRVSRDCSTCHGSTAKSSVQTVVSSKVTNCDACHNQTVLQQDIHPDYVDKHRNGYPQVAGLDCKLCHTNFDTISEHAGNKDKNGNTMDCNTCHGSGKTTPKDNKITIKSVISQTDPVTCGSCHNIHSDTTTIHTTNYTAVQGLDCASCHNDINILSNHAGNKDKNGNLMSCNTCHNADKTIPKDTNIKVQTIINQAINDKTSQLDCSSCHNIHQDVNTLHASGFMANKPYDVSCISCHQSGLNTEHIGKIDKAGNKITCYTCHESSNLAVLAATKSNVTYCDACHNQTVLGQDIHPQTQINSAHNTKVPVVSGLDCQLCHSSFNPISNHVGQVAKDGSKMSCNICHGAGSVTPKDNKSIQELINTNTVSGCESCHNIHADANTLHKVNTYANPLPFAYFCSNCHKSTLNEEHIGKTDTNKNDITCLTCHNSNKIGVQDTIKAEKTNCDACHNNTVLQQNIHIDSDDKHTKGFDTVNGLTCANCHSGMNVISSGHVGKKAKDGITIMTCDTCHSSGSLVPKNNDPLKPLIESGGVSKCSSCHIIHPDVNTLHNITTYSSSTPPFELACSNCHKNTLNSEHIGKKDKAGNDITCNTCHESSVAQVTDVIKAGKTNCDACHTVHAEKTFNEKHTKDYLTVNNTGLTCTNCHNGMNVISAGHVGKLTKDGKTMTCDTCHASGSVAPNNNSIQALINTDAVKDCSSCHDIHTDVTYLHTVKTYAVSPPFDVECNNCHEISLNDEHIGKTTISGKMITCEDCHNNDKLGVQAAITTGATNCDACHNAEVLGKTIHTDYSDRHILTNGFNQVTGLECATCHSGFDKISNHAGKVTSKGTTMDCNTCHGVGKTTPVDSEKLISTVITQSDPITCGSCHSIHEDVTTLHNTEYTKVDGLTCSNCHGNLNVISNHAGQEANGGTTTMDCNTCHGTGKTTPKDNTPIQTIISNGGTVNCSSCHDIHSDVNAIHTISTYTTTPAFNLSCTTCHQSTLNAEHLGKLGSNGIITCDTCHQSKNLSVQTAINTDKSNCDACHVVHPDETLNIKHKQTYPSLYGLDCANCHTGMDVINSGHVGKQAKDGSTIDCYTCHGATSKLPKDNTTLIQPLIASGGVTDCSSCHDIHTDITTPHNSIYVEEQLVDCAGCHNSNLSTEHANRNDVNGNPYTCATCHSSNNNNVQTAITIKDTKCDACHLITHNQAQVIEESHTLTVTSFVENQTFGCNGCHQQNLAAEHMLRQKPDGTYYDCNTCHEDPKMQNIIGQTSTAASSIAKLVVLNENSGEITNKDNNNNNNNNNNNSGNITKKPLAKVKCDSCHKTLHTSVNEAHYLQYDKNNKSQCQGCHKMHPKSSN